MCRQSADNYILKTTQHPSITKTFTGVCLNSSPAFKKDKNENNTITQQRHTIIPELYERDGLVVERSLRVVAVLLCAGDHVRRGNIPSAGDGREVATQPLQATSPRGRVSYVLVQQQYSTLK